MFDNGENLFDLTYNALTSIFCSRRFLQWNYLTAIVRPIYLNYLNEKICKKHQFCMRKITVFSLQILKAWILFQLYSNLFINLTDLERNSKIEKPYPFSLIENNTFDPSFERQGNITQAETEHGELYSLTLLHSCN